MHGTSPLCHPVASPALSMLADELRGDLNIALCMILPAAVAFRRGQEDFVIRSGRQAGDGKGSAAGSWDRGFKMERGVY